LFKPLFADTGDWLIARLKARRQNIPEYALRFYKNLAGYVEIVGRDSPEVVEIDQNTGSDVTVRIIPWDIRSGEKNISLCEH
jgi:hypothetical protein